MKIETATTTTPDYPSKFKPLTHTFIQRGTNRLFVTIPSFIQANLLSPLTVVDSLCNEQNPIKQ